ncbi:MAG TPA: hypothetical protein VHR86_04320 [Armatimonadota bacterium]|nr:hypothetical protein [Armatimonadota bacterium]
MLTPNDLWREYEGYADVYREELREYIQGIGSDWGAEAARVYESFIQGLLSDSLFGDKPPLSWRWLVSYKGVVECPVFCVYRSSTGFSNKFFRVWAKDMEILHFDENVLEQCHMDGFRYRKLFPKPQKGAMGKMDAVHFSSSLFDGEHSQDEYIEAIGAIVHGDPDITFAFPRE